MNNTKNGSGYMEPLRVDGNTSRFFWDGDLRADQDLVFTQTVVAGDLYVGGNLKADEVICIGDLHVDGKIEVGSLMVGGSVVGKKDIHAEVLRAGIGCYYVARVIEKIQAADDDGTLLRIKRDTCPRFEPDHNKADGPFPVAIRSADSIRCARLETNGGVEAGGDVHVGRAFVDGHLCARIVCISEKLAITDWINYRYALVIPTGPKPCPIYFNENLQ